MENKPTKWQIFKIKLGLGVPFAPTVNLGKIDSHTVIRFKDYYVGLMERDGEIINFSWSKDPHNFPDVNINEHWLATPPSKRRGIE